MISESELSRFVADKHRLIVELLARGILRPTWTCAQGREHFPSVQTRRFRCRCERRDAMKSIYYSSFFENTRLTMATIFRIVYDWLSESPVRVCAFRRNVSPNSVGVYYGYCRQLVYSSLATAPVRVGGVGISVEVDEMFVRRDAETGDEVWVLGALYGRQKDACTCPFCTRRHQRLSSRHFPTRFCQVRCSSLIFCLRIRLSHRRSACHTRASTSRSRSSIRPPGFTQIT
jgi:hypothetical protein